MFGMIRWGFDQKKLGVGINFLLLLLMSKAESTLEAVEVEKFIAQNKTSNDRILEVTIFNA